MNVTSKTLEVDLGTYKLFNKPRIWNAMEQIGKSKIPDAISSSLINSCGIKSLQNEDAIIGALKRMYYLKKNKIPKIPEKMKAACQVLELIDGEVNKAKLYLTQFKNVDLTRIPYFIADYKNEMYEVIYLFIY